MTEPFPLVEKALVELIETKIEDAEDRVGGDLDYDPTEPFYIWLGLVPGGATDQIYGDWVVDIDVFAGTYSAAMRKALDVEAAIIGPRHDTSVMRIDNCYQNEGPAERPWEDETVFRIGATYVFTARRSG